MSSAEDCGPYSQLVSPLGYGQHFDTHLRKAALPDIFHSVNHTAMQRLFERSGDKKAEERARIICSNQSSEEISRALLALRVRRKAKLTQLFRMGWKSLKIFS
ncbi:transcriptional and immune response regulator-like [Hypanus sabinus]|uniref:transcriptional and immune response regulator-like n=1 Tax=Hypanus sabinus TaxID=79690 RepID=UPI0028C45289|nr:transcriptional and immune response regulator-like [Hypanus sabinus]